MNPTESPKIFKTKKHFDKLQHEQLPVVLKPDVSEKRNQG